MKTSELKFRNNFMIKEFHHEKFMTVYERILNCSSCRYNLNVAKFKITGYAGKKF